MLECKNLNSEPSLQDQHATPMQISSHILFNYFPGILNPEWKSSSVFKLAVNPLLVVFKSSCCCHWYHDKGMNSDAYKIYKWTQHYCRLIVYSFISFCLFNTLKIIDTSGLMITLSFFFMNKYVSSNSLTVYVFLHTSVGRPFCSASASPVLLR